MAPRILFNLILKIIGLFFIRDILEALSHTLSTLIYFPEYTSVREAFFNVGTTLPPLILYILLAWLFIFKSDKIIDVLRLEKDMSGAPITVNAERSSLLSAGVVIAGIWVLVNEIPEFFRHAMYYYQERKMYVRMTRPDVSYIVMSFIKIVIGLLLVVFNKPVVNVIEWGGGTHLTSPKSSATSRKAEKEKTVG
jgi:hypothetical protein